ncbi:PaaI family thioesterase [Williamsia deligens]|uniref:PaaI family thioesterase n=1 Tax=Williamsia deligens TaxID=321325 RepID=A0ABW3G7K6_9NOCA|nr:hotdog fold thioesterase [Williamsia deligens]MCP2194219.1 putative domain 1-containing protein [Williamsia deligens]
MTTVPTWVSIAEQFHDPAETRFELSPAPDASSSEKLVMQMPIGRWRNPATGAVSAGLLAMLVDSAGGTADFLAFGGDRATVTSELSVDLVAPLPSTADVATSSGRTVAVDAATAMASSTIAVDGAVVGYGTVRTMPVPGAATPLGAMPADGLSGGERDDLSLMLGLGASIDDVTDGESVVALPDPCLQNGIGIVHGGIIVAAAETVASVTMNRGRTAPLSTGAIRANYLRPMATGGDARYEARIVRAGRGTAVVDVTAVSADGKTAAVVRVTGYAVGA